MTGLTTNQTEQLRVLVELMEHAEQLLDGALRPVELEWGSYNPLYPIGAVAHLRVIAQIKLDECPVCGGDKDGHTHGTWREDAAPYTNTSRGDAGA